MLRDNGLAIISELTQHYEIAYFVDALQGIKFDNNSRAYGVYFDRESLEDVFAKVDLQICSRQVS